MSVVIQGRTYGYDNISAGNAYGQERNQSQFFPYTPGTDSHYPDNAGSPDAGSAIAVNLERSGNTSPATLAYGTEIPALLLACVLTWAASICLV